MKREQLHSTALHQIVNMMLQCVGYQVERWLDLFKSMPSMTDMQYADLIERLQCIQSSLSLPELTAIWNGLRECIAKHKPFPDAQWALSPERVELLEKVYESLTPDNMVARTSWLFGDTHAFLARDSQDDWRAHQEKHAKARLAAVKEVYAQTGYPGILEFTELVEHPHELGRTLGEYALSQNEEDALLRSYLASEDARYVQFARGFVVGRLMSQGRVWGENKFMTSLGEWSPAQQSGYLICLPCDQRTWEMAMNAGSETERQYWTLIQPQWIDEKETEQAVRQYLKWGRPITAVNLIAHHLNRFHTVSPELIVETLEHLLQASIKDDPHLQSLFNDVPTLFNALDPSDSINEKQIAALEWAFIVLLENPIRKRGAKCLYRELTRDPEFFAQVVALAEGAQTSQATEEQVAQAEHGYRLLENWRTVPGVGEDCEVNPGVLIDWIERARKLLSESGHRDIGDQMIGQVLSSSPQGSDGVWPHQTVRDIIEDAPSDDLERGFEISHYNRRGYIQVNPDRDQQLADKYEAFAVAVSSRWPRTAALLRRLARTYRAQARRDELEEEIRKDLER